METEPLQIRLAVRELVEFVLRRGSIDRRFSGLDRANEPYPPQAAKSGGRFL